MQRYASHLALAFYTLSYTQSHNSMPSRRGKKTPLMIKFDQVARQNLITTGVSSKVEIVLGPALDSLAAMPTPPESEMFDMAFIDADNKSNLPYFLEAKRMVRPGGVIVRIQIVLSYSALSLVRIVIVLIIW